MRAIAPEKAEPRLLSTRLCFGFDDTLRLCQEQSFAKPVAEIEAPPMYLIEPCKLAGKRMAELAGAEQIASSSNTFDQRSCTGCCKIRKQEIGQ